MADKCYVTVECPHCEAHVRSEVLAEIRSFNPDDTCPDSRVSLARCARCGEALLTSETCHGWGEVEGFASLSWGPPKRLWPRPALEFDPSIPSIVRISLDEADRCLHARAYTACAVMCGRALEGICQHYGIKGTLNTSLQELRVRGLIDERLLEWGNHLRSLRNSAAHASEERVTHDDATDLLHFLTAICN